MLGVLALVENHGLRADEWRDITIDRAIVNGHFYSDKAPLSTFLVAPFFFVWRAMVRRPLERADMDTRLRTLGDVVAAAIPFAAFVALLQRRAAKWMRGSDAVWIALLAAFGTVAFPYAGMYLGHVLAGALFVFAYHFATSDRERDAYLAGVLAGLTVLAEYPMAISVAILGVYLALRHPKLALRYAIGGLPCAVA